MKSEAPRSPFHTHHPPQKPEVCKFSREYTAPPPPNVTAEFYSVRKRVWAKKIGVREWGKHRCKSTFSLPSLPLTLSFSYLLPYLPTSPYLPARLYIHRDPARTRPRYLTGWYLCFGWMDGWMWRMRRGGYLIGFYFRPFERKKKKKERRNEKKRAETKYRSRLWKMEMNGGWWLWESYYFHRRYHIDRSSCLTMFHMSTFQNIFL